MTQKTIKILLVEDSKLCAHTLRRVIESIGSFPVDLVHRDTMGGAILFLEEGQGGRDINLILLDLGLPDTCSDEESFTRIRDAAPQIPVVVLTGKDDHDLAKSMVMGGAQDYVSKDSVSANPEVLVNAVDFAISRNSSQQQINAKLKRRDQVISWMSGGYSVEPVSRESNG